MYKLSKGYHRLRFITIALASIMLPFGTFVGYEFGSGNYTLALIALIIQTALTAFQSYLWWLTLEREGEEKLLPHHDDEG